MLLCFNELSDSETSSCLHGQVCRYCFNEFNDKDNSVLFNFRESKGDGKATPVVLFRNVIP